MTGECIHAYITTARSHDCHVTFHSGVAATLDAPGTQYELDCIRPDFLLLRVSSESGTRENAKLQSFYPLLFQALSRGLIMWDNIQPAQEWIDSHIPEVTILSLF